MRRIVLLCAVFQCLLNGSVGAATQLTNQERAIVYVIGEETRDFALEARTDVCVDFATELAIRESAVFAALRAEGLNFHAARWCNRGPRGVDISIAMPSKETPPGTYQMVSDISDSDPIRLYGDHFATLLRSGTYVIRCTDGSEPILESYHQTCCEKGTSKPEATKSPN